MNISIIGAGYVGLVTGTCLAEKGHQVTCIDLDEEKVSSINNGQSPIYEDGLETLLQKNVGDRLSATTNLPAAVHDTELSVIAVGTPFDGSTIDLSHIKQAAQDVGAALRTKRAYHTVIVKSTVVPGTTNGPVRNLIESTAQKQAGEDFRLGMNPEFLREGEAVRDFMNPDRIVMGGDSARTIDALETLYAPFEPVDTVHTSIRTAEMIKYASNALLASMISFSNEIGNLCAELDNVDVVDVMRGVHLDDRLSPFGSNGDRIEPGFISYLEAGCGFGGSCFPKDVKALIAHGEEEGVSMPMLDAAIETNEQQPMQLLELLERHFSDLQNRSVAVLGLSFKPGTDDMRESPAIPVVRSLQDRDAHVRAYDPIALDEARNWFDGEGLTYCGSMEDAIDDTEAVVVVTRWPEFKQLDELLSDRGPQPLVVDGRRMLDKDAFERYEGIGL